MSLFLSINDRNEMDQSFSRNTFSQIVEEDL